MTNSENGNDNDSSIGQIVVKRENGVDLRVDLSLVTRGGVSVDGDQDSELQDAVAVTATPNESIVGTWTKTLLGVGLFIFGSVQGISVGLAATPGSVGTHLGVFSVFVAGSILTFFKTKKRGQAKDLTLDADIWLSGLALICVSLGVVFGLYWGIAFRKCYFVIYPNSCTSNDLLGDIEGNSGHVSNIPDLQKRDSKLCSEIRFRRESRYEEFVDEHAKQKKRLEDDKEWTLQCEGRATK